MTDAQPQWLRAMRDPGFYPHPVRSVSVCETHISLVFLTGEFVYKIKKPVDLGFLDFTTLSKRQHYCRREVALNRRLTTGVYLGVVPITEGEDGLHLDGPGTPVEYAVQMRQLSERYAMKRLLADNKIDASAIELLARTLHRFYAEAASGPEIDGFGSRETVEKNCEENFRQIESAGEAAVDRRRLQIVAAATRGFLARGGDVFRQRVANGNIRDCHGDLRTDHIYFTAGGLQIIDCIEFNKRFRYGDIASDLAFLAMELDFQGYPRLAGTLVTAIAGHSGDRQLFTLLDFYKCYRAMVRVKVKALRLRQDDVEKDERARILDEMHRYLDLAYRYAIQFSRPMLWVMCGQAAAGKSTVAAALADSLCARCLRSDVVRKELFEESSLKGGPVPFGEGIYSPEATSLTYGRLLLLAQREIEKGRSIVLDATFGRSHHRREALRLAEETGAAIVFVVCECSEATLRQRLQRRTSGDSVSDARLRHLERLEAAFEKPDELSNQCLVRIDTERSVDKNLQTIFSYTATPRNCLERGWTER